MVTGYGSGFTDNGSLFLAVWDASNNKSYVRDLGTYIDSFLPATVAPAAGYSTTFTAATSAFTTQFGASTASNIRWAVIGADAIDSDGSARYVTTLASGVPYTLNSGGIRQLTANASGYMGDLIANVLNEADWAVDGAEYVSVGKTSTDAAGSLIAAPLNLFLSNSVSSNYGSAYFWLGTAAGTNGDNDAASWTQYSSGSLATVTLASDGTLSYSVSAVPTQLPGPAAAWLMASGLAAMGVAAKRRKAITQG
jgi:hypothetical protein